MFGPDICGRMRPPHIHFVFQHKNRTTNIFEEKHLNTVDPEKIRHIFNDNKFHLVRLKLSDSNEFEIKLDDKIISSGSVFENFNPPVDPPKFIEDIEDIKPNDWDDRETIPDLTATKPDDFDQCPPPYISNPKEKKPDDWVEDEPEYLSVDANKPEDDNLYGEWNQIARLNPKCKNKKCGKWTPSQIPNFKYKKWSPPVIKNPAYKVKGKWKPKMIPNSNYYHDEHPFRMRPIMAIGFEFVATRAGTG
ncbi:hypothetical protein HZS_4661 [Henneguya salminicola]|nr:hypothetical protein HZS_4661 [Henneguya salminicola]